MAQELGAARSEDDASVSILDLSVMEQLLSLDDGAFGLLEEMLFLYKDDTPGRFTAMEQALAASDMTELADVAHAVKGAASTMGASRVRAIAAEMEAGGRQGKCEQDPGLLLEQLKAAFRDSYLAIESFVALQKP